jgi:hemerythrin-like domain-containing protein
MAIKTGERMPYRTADTRDALALHRALRRMADYLVAVTPAMAAGDLVAAGTVADLATEFADAVHRWHDAERELLWPVLRAYLVACEAYTTAAELLRIETQGERVTAVLAEIAPVAARLRADADPLDRDTLADLFVTLRAELGHHLGDKERTVLPLAASYMTAAQWDEIGRQFLQGVSTQRRVWRLGAMLRECSRRSDRSRIVRRCEGHRGITSGRVRRAFAREFGRIQDVLGEESTTAFVLKLTAAR